MPTTSDRPATLLALAERIEQESRLGGPLATLFDRFRAVLGEPRWATPTTEADGIARLHRIVEQLADDAASGHVRSISGLVALTRRCVEPGRHPAAHPAA